jgi:hypothetical protein
LTKPGHPDEILDITRVRVAEDMRSSDKPIDRELMAQLENSKVEFDKISKQWKLARCLAPLAAFAVFISYIWLVSPAVAEASPGCFNQQYEHMDYVPCDTPGAQKPFPGLTIHVNAGNTVLPGRYIAPNLTDAMNFGVCIAGLTGIGLAVDATGGTAVIVAPEAAEITQHVAESCNDVVLTWQEETGGGS